MLVDCMYGIGKIMATDTQSKHPSSPADAEALVTQLRGEGLLSAEFLEGQLAAMRAETGEKAVAVVAVEGKSGKKELSLENQRDLLSVLRGRFYVNKELHPNLQWADVEKSLQAASPEILFGLYKMEETGGEPDVFMDDKDAFVFGDCSAESPVGRRNCVYDKEAEQYASGFNGNAVDMAAAMGVDLMDEAQYRALQDLMPVDTENTWSRLKTPADVRESGDALFGGRVGSSVGVGRDNAYNHGGSGAFRAALRVPKVA